MSIPLFLLTFNCGKIKLNSEQFVQSLANALPESPPDLFVFGFQEICSILDGSFSASVHKHMITLNSVILGALKLKYSSNPESPFGFTTIGIHHIGAIGMIAVTPFVSKFGACRFASASCGSANSSLKGGVGLRVKYTQANETTELTFATAHLSAQEGDIYYQKRLKDINTIMRAMDFGDGYSYLKPGCHAFFMGDLNFRTTKDLKKNNSVVKELADLQTPQEVTKEYVKQLVSQYDELTKGRIDSEVLSGFNEGSITFRPTYKFHLNTAIYNTKRCPSWCDRIFFQATYRTTTKPSIHRYDSLSEYLGSDHRPVFLHLSVPVKAPAPIIDANGFLVVLPVTAHLENNTLTKDFDLSSNSVSGPTQVYMRFTTLDKLTQYCARTIADFSIGYGLWFGTTSKGRITFLLLTLLSWLCFIMN